MQKPESHHLIFTVILYIKHRRKKWISTQVVSYPQFKKLKLSRIGRVQRLVHGSFNKTEQRRCLCYHNCLVKLASFKKGFTISSSVSHLYVAGFLFAVICWPFPALQRMIQHNTSTKCQGYTTDLIVCYWHHTSLCILVIQSNTVPTVNWKKKNTTHKENQSNSTGKKRWRELDREKQTFFTEKKWLLFYFQWSSKKR